MPKIKVRFISVSNELERDKLRLKLNALGFYVLTVIDGLDVYVVHDRFYMESILANLFGGENYEN